MMNKGSKVAGDLAALAYPSDGFFLTSGVLGSRPRTALGQGGWPTVGSLQSRDVTWLPATLLAPPTRLNGAHGSSESRNGRVKKHPSYLSSYTGPCPGRPGNGSGVSGVFVCVYPRRLKRRREKARGFQGALERECKTHTHTRPPRK